MKRVVLSLLLLQNFVLAQINESNVCSFVNKYYNGSGFPRSINKFSNKEKHSNVLNFDNNDIYFGFSNDDYKTGLTCSGISGIPKNMSNNKTLLWATYSKYSEEAELSVGITVPYHGYLKAETLWKHYEKNNFEININSKQVNNFKNNSFWGKVNIDCNKYKIKYLHIAVAGKNQLSTNENYKSFIMKQLEDNERSYIIYKFKIGGINLSTASPIS